MPSLVSGAVVSHSRLSASMPLSNGNNEAGIRMVLTAAVGSNQDGATTAPGAATALAAATSRLVSMAKANAAEETAASIEADVLRDEDE